jgi:uncharacterized protein YecE (DUF72 family)
MGDRERAQGANGELRIGTAGWHYPGGRGTWNGIVYPDRRARRGTGFDDLRYYAERFDTVEVNTSFYRPVTRNMAESWVSRTPDAFRFSLKLYQKFTHPELYAARSGTPDPTILSADVDEVHRGLEPIAASGKLGALLAQFPPSFVRDDVSREYLSWLLETFRAYPIAVELRHSSWSDQAEDTLALLNESRAAWAQIDEPKFRFSIRQDFLRNVRGFYYMRLHGRNAAKWWKHDEAEDRYDYLYSSDELEPFAEIAEAVRTLVKKLYLYTNNHFAGKAVANAIMLRQRLGLPTPGDYPAALAERYPELQGRVAVRPAASGALF